jgi:hypothetical protein
MAAEAAIHVNVPSGGALPVRRSVEDLSLRLIEEVAPFRVHALDQTNLPSTLPFLELRLATDRRLHRLVHLVVNELMHPVTLVKPSMRSCLWIATRSKIELVTPIYKIPFGSLARM